MRYLLGRLRAATRRRPAPRVAIIGAGLATAARGPRWPVMSARFDRAPGGPGGMVPTMWESLSRDIDPTLESELDGGTRG